VPLVLQIVINEQKRVLVYVSRVPLLIFKFFFPLPRSVSVSIKIFFEIFAFFHELPFLSPPSQKVAAPPTVQRLQGSPPPAALLGLIFFPHPAPFTSFPARRSSLALLVLDRSPFQSILVLAPFSDPLFFPPPGVPFPRDPVDLDPFFLLKFFPLFAGVNSCLIFPPPRPPFLDVLGSYPQLPNIFLRRRVSQSPLVLASFLVR